MAWPTLAQVKTTLGVTTNARDDVIGSALAAAIEQVKIDTFGSAADFDAELEESEPAIALTDSLSNAALILAVMVVKAPDAPYGVAAVFDTGGLTVASVHPTYTRLLTGSRHSFGVG